MPKFSREFEPPCEECISFLATKKRELKQFPNGQMYMVTGTCRSKESKLFERDLTGSQPASNNGEHQLVTSVGERLRCFRAREQ